MVIYSFAFEDFEFGNTDTNYIEEMRDIFVKIELAILLFFMLEILLNVYVYGAKLYYHSNLTIIDSFIIAVSVLLAFVDLYTVSAAFSNISRFLRGTSRFFRIFMLFRKMQQFKAVKATNRGMNVSPLEQVLRILRDIKPSLEKAAHVKNVDWVIDVLVEKKLYAPLIQERNQESQERIQEVNKWIEGYSPTKAKRRISSLKTRRLSGSVSDEIIRKSIILDIPISIIRNFSNIDELEFDAFKSCDISKENSLPNLLVYLFHKYDILGDLEIMNTKLVAFGIKLQNSYRNNPFHNFLHAFDTCQTLNFLLAKMGIAKRGNYSKLEIGALLITAAGHDVDHP